MLNYQLDEMVKSVLKSIINLGGNKLEWGRSTIETGFVAFESELNDKSVFSVGDSITAAGQWYYEQILFKEDHFFLTAIIKEGW